MLGCMIAKAGAARNMADVTATLPKHYFCSQGAIPPSCLLSDVDCLYQSVGAVGAGG